MEYKITIPADHPSLPGHFPGQPVVPGVVILSEVVSVLEQMLGYNVVVEKLPAVKFLHPLLPEQTFRVELEQNKPDQVKFQCIGDEAVLANGSLCFRPSPDSDRN